MKTARPHTYLHLMTQAARRSPCGSVRAVVAEDGAVEEDNTIHAKEDTFSFDMHKGNNYQTLNKNLFTIIANIEAKKGKEFKIYFYGPQNLK